jgi:hypothetical protein
MGGHQKQFGRFGQEKNWKDERKGPWHILKYYPRVFLEELKTSVRTGVRAENCTGHLEYKSETLSLLAIAAGTKYSNLLAQEITATVTSAVVSTAWKGLRNSGKMVSNNRGIILLERRRKTTNSLRRKSPALCLLPTITTAQ